MFWFKIAIIIIVVIFLFRRHLFAFLKAVFVAAYNSVVAMLGNVIAKIVLFLVCVFLISIITK